MAQYIVARKRPLYSTKKVPADPQIIKLIRTSPGSHWELNIHGKPVKFRSWREAQIAIDSIRLSKPIHIVIEQK